MKLSVSREYVEKLSFSHVKSKLSCKKLNYCDLIKPNKSDNIFFAVKSCMAQMF